MERDEQKKRRGEVETMVMEPRTERLGFYLAFQLEPEQLFYCSITLTSQVVAHQYLFQLVLSSIINLSLGIAKPHLQPISQKQQDFGVTDASTRLTLSTPFSLVPASRPATARFDQKVFRDH